MMKEERQRLILDQIHANKKINFVELSNLLNVSYDSVRRDVIELEDKGFLKKVHGGAVANSYLNVLGDSKAKGNELKIIQKKAQMLFKEESVIIMDGGTTNFFIAEQLPKRLNATIVTNSPPLAMALNEHPNLSIILLGGTYYKHYQITLGIDVVRQIEHIKADMYFMGVNGVDVQNGLTIRNYEEAILKNKMMEASKQTICCAIEEKLNVVETYKVAGLDTIDTLITDLNPDDNRLVSFRKSQISII